MNSIIRLFDMLENQSKLSKIKIFNAIETVDDPYEKTKTLTYLNPTVIRGYITPLSFSSLKWKYYGQLPMGSIQILIEKKHINNIKSANKIEIDDNQYKTYKDSDKGFAIKEHNDYIIIVLERVL